ncbi:alcohol dehydrogenase catalytic domain-containing protein [Pyxidicoccus trucidator]|uniref:alcohol dehydrogenase catalytic domain-containing protein n=1 Tax=Pyxidicoccus trucidator TaxID=2709662 RepID=UPI0013DB5F6C|nr:alcohol dehydrogenase catalytic domain-containing protein [Pyxidicoccus trucidator]
MVVKIAAASINHLDSHCRKGVRTPDYYWPRGPSPLPHIPGIDGAGTVVAVGPGVTRLREGDRVVLFCTRGCGACEHCFQGNPALCRDVYIVGRDCNGTYAEFVTAREDHWVPLPESIGFETAAAVPGIYTWAWAAVRKAGLRVGSTVLVPRVNGGVSAAVIQLAKLHGATVFATAEMELMAQRATELGADAVLPLEGFAAELRERTGGRGVDAVFDHVALDWPQLLASLRSAGTLVTWGATGRQMPVERLEQLFYREVIVRGTSTGSSDEFREVLALVRSGRLSPIIDGKIHLSGAADASHRAEGISSFGKILLIP